MVPVHVWGSILVQVRVYCRVGGLHGDSMLVNMDVSSGASTGVWEGGFCTVEGHCDKRLACFPSPGGMIISGQGEFG